MKFVLILMMKNEEKILKRCLEAAEKVVEGFCILDTGSTDSSKEIALDFLKTRTGCLTEDPFRDFGYSRTKSFENAQKYLKDNNWNLSETYGLLLDADMVFVPGTLTQQKLTAIGYSMIQKNGSMEYFNARLVRMDHPWKCVSVTHEYWDGIPQRLPKSTCFIDDKNDGGCKSDKFERDRRLLEKGLADEPTNVRYMFYLAQTYKSLGMFKEAIAMYQKRVNAGGWQEEVYYSLYMIGDCYLCTKDIFNFECYMQMAHKYRPCRAESIYKLAEFYRLVGEHYKSYHYIQLGRKIPFPNEDVLFIETNVYNFLFDVEASIVEYYVHRERGLTSSVIAMLKTTEYNQLIVSNMKYYAQPVAIEIQNLDIPRVFGEDFRASAVSLANYPLANVRFVNYWIDNGEYKTKHGCDVQTQNAYMNIETGELLKKMEDASVSLPRFPTNVKGLEDVRLYKFNGNLRFTTTSVREYEEGMVRVVDGQYNETLGTYSDVSVLNSPNDNPCEKNWLPIENTNKFIYRWFPLAIGEKTGSSFNIIKNTPVPNIFSLFRGSAPPIRFNNNFMALVHFGEYSKIRNYFHCFVELSEDLSVIRMSAPFVFEKNGIEYCVSFRNTEKSFVECYFSSMDCHPKKAIIDLEKIMWFKFNNDSPIEEVPTIKYPPNADVYWAGYMSEFYPDNAMENYVKHSIRTQNLNLQLIIAKCDGISNHDHFYTEERNIEHGFLMKDSEFDELEKLTQNKKPVICILCSRGPHRDNMLYLPLDDNTFDKGLNIPNSIPWDSRQSIAFWRGSAAGYDPVILRLQVVQELMDHKYSDVKLRKWWGWEDRKSISDEKYFGDGCVIEYFTNYKYILIIDGVMISSSHQWVFGSGSVPIMITHPENEYWFKKFLRPMTNYVPVKYDLSDLKEKIEWLVNNDDKAKDIASKALALSRLLFSSDFQKKYVDMELRRIADLPAR
jgi:tetratricopeptide (TPR) repeat protein